MSSQGAALNTNHVYPANTKHLYNISSTSAQRFRRWSNIVQMLYKCFVFAGQSRFHIFCLFFKQTNYVKNEH